MRNDPPILSKPVRIDEVPEGGSEVVIEADAATRAALAKEMGILGIDRLVARFELARRGGSGMHVGGHVEATVRQSCVVTLEPLTADLDEPVDLEFTTKPRIPVRERDAAEAESAGEADDPPELVEDGVVDLGALAAEFVVLGLDPYPRKPGVVFEQPSPGDDDPGPFAALAALKKSRES